MLMNCPSSTGRPRDVRQTSKRTIQDRREVDVPRRDNWIACGLLSDNPEDVPRMSVGRDPDNDEKYWGNYHLAQCYINYIPGISS